MSRFFLDRPVFAWVIAITMMLAVAWQSITCPSLSTPPIAPPSIAITATYPGASAKTVEDSVTQIIEQKMTGLDKMLYMSATSDSSGQGALTLTFAPGTDPDLAWSKVQNKLQLAMPMLARGRATARRHGQQVHPQLSDGGRPGLRRPHVDENDLTDYAVSQVQPPLGRVPGVGEVEAFGSQYSMRIWLDPDKLTEYNMTFDDIAAGISAYNVEVSAGQFGGLPAVSGQRLNASIVVQSLLKTPEEFGAIPLRNNPDGSIVRVRDVARTEMGTEFYDHEGIIQRQAAGRARHPPGGRRQCAGHRYGGEG